MPHAMPDTRCRRPLARLALTRLALTRLALAIACIAQILPLVSCQDTPDPSRAAQTPTRSITAADFAADAPPADRSTQPAVTQTNDNQPAISTLPTADDQARPPEPIRIISINEARGGIDAQASTSPTTVQPASTDQANPPAAPTDPVRMPPSIIIDAKIGDINGKAIYASEFFKSLDARFRAEAKTLPRNEWLAKADAEIRRKLNDMVNQELLRAEALASLTPEQRSYGIRAFMNSIRRDLRLRNQGSTALAGRRLADESGTGLTVDEMLQQRTEQALVAQQLDAKVRQRVHISWREIQREYDRLWDEFNPNPTAMFRLIRVRSDDADAIAAISSALAAGTPFDQVAALPANGHRPEEGGLIPRELTDGLASVKLARSDTVNEAARALAPGQVVGPIADDGFTYWIQLDKVVRQATPLYDAQLLIASQLQDSAGNEEFRNYIDHLRADASYTDLDRMARRLLAIAAARYDPQPDRQ